MRISTANRRYPNWSNLRQPKVDKQIKNALTFVGRHLLRRYRPVIRTEAHDQNPINHCQSGPVAGHNIKCKAGRLPPNRRAETELNTATADLVCMVSRRSEIHQLLPQTLGQKFITLLQGVLPVALWGLKVRRVYATPRPYGGKETRHISLR